MTPTIGRIVHYRLTDKDVEQITRRRQDAKNSLDWHRSNRTGAQVHVGNPVVAGDVYPLIITKVMSDAPDFNAFNGQVMLDGNDSLWVKNISIGDAEGDAFWPPRV